jgi:hypothetical protein
MQLLSSSIDPSFSKWTISPIVIDQCYIPWTIKQYINAYENHWILCHIHPSSISMHCMIYNSMTPSNRRLSLNIVNKLKRVLNIQGNVRYTYANIPQYLEAILCGLFTIAYAILPSQSNYNVSLMYIHLHTYLSVVTSFLMYSRIWLCSSIHSYCIWFLILFDIRCIIFCWYTFLNAKMKIIFLHIYIMWPFITFNYNIW